MRALLFIFLVIDNRYLPEIDYLIPILGEAGDQAVDDVAVFVDVLVAVSFDGRGCREQGTGEEVAVSLLTASD